MPLYPIVAWIPMLYDDERSSAVAMAAMFADKPIPQFWDGEHLLGKEVTRSIATDQKRDAWDIYLFYSPGVEWTDQGLPRPDKVIAQSNGVVIGAKGTLPPGGDQARLPEWAEGRADVVGEPSELASLLATIAASFSPQR